MDLWHICLASSPDLCIAVPNIKDGSRAVLARKDAKERRQQWRYDPDSQTFLSQSSKRVLDLDGSNVVQRPFNDKPTQKWEYDAGNSHLRNLSSPRVLLDVTNEVSPGALMVLSPRGEQWILVSVADPNILFGSPAPAHPPPAGGGFFGQVQTHLMPRPSGPQVPHPPADYDDAPGQHPPPHGRAAGGRRAPQPPGDYGGPHMGSPGPAFSQPIFSVTVNDHPEFVLDYGPSPSPGSGLCINRPERMPLQCWVREARGDAFVLKSVVEPRLALGVGTEGGACMVPERDGAIWQSSDRDHTLRTASVSETQLLLAVKDGSLTQWAPVIVTPDESLAQKWKFWREQQV
jgi:hypothetical protein